jgi:xylan 1,4-beta-xylosidase
MQSSTFAMKSSSSITLSAKAEAKPLEPFWNLCVGAGRANEGLRAGWRDHLKMAVEHCGFRYLRFHGLYHDDMCVCRRVDGKLLFNWQYLDDLFDFLLESGVRPFVEFGFFPKEIAKPSDVHCFWWKGNVTPPEDFTEWNQLVEQSLRHWIERYGLEEVRKWYFEVWNEPNLPFFFNGTRDQYFALYRETARTVKKVDPSLRVGGPATSNFVCDGRFDDGPEDRSKLKPLEERDLEAGNWEGVWIKTFLEFCEREKLPVDFVSSHPYPTDFAIDHGNQGVTHSRSSNATRQDLAWMRKVVSESAYPHAEIHLTEWNSSPSDRDFTHDFPQAATFIMKANLESIDLVESLSYWVFTDVFEERGAGDAAFHGGFGLINYQGIPKPAFHAYRFLNMLGREELGRSKGLVVTRSADGGVRIALYNYPDEHPLSPPVSKTAEDALRTLGTGSPYTWTINLTDLPPNAALTLETVDSKAAFPFAHWQNRGGTSSPSREEIVELRKAGWDTKKQTFRADESGRLNASITLNPWAIAVLRPE